MNNKNEHENVSDRERLVKMLKALGNPVRFQIVQFLAQRQVCITNDIVRNTPLAQSTVSQHLKVLREAGLIKGDIEGVKTCYCIDDKEWTKAKTYITDLFKSYELAAKNCC